MTATVVGQVALAGFGALVGLLLGTAWGTALRRALTSRTATVPQPRPVADNDPDNAPAAGRVTGLDAGVAAALDPGTAAGAAALDRLDTAVNAVTAVTGATGAAPTMTAATPPAGPIGSVTEPPLPAMPAERFTGHVTAVLTSWADDDAQTTLDAVAAFTADAREGGPIGWTSDYLALVDAIASAARTARDDFVPAGLALRTGTVTTRPVNELTPEQVLRVTALQMLAAALNGQHAIVRAFMTRAFRAARAALDDPGLSIEELAEQAGRVHDLLLHFVLEARSFARSLPSLAETLAAANRDGVDQPGSVDEPGSGGDEGCGQCPACLAQSTARRSQARWN